MFSSIPSSKSSALLSRPSDLKAREEAFRAETERILQLQKEIDALKFAAAAPAVALLSQLPAEPAAPALPAPASPAVPATPAQAPSGKPPLRRLESGCEVAEGVDYRAAPGATETMEEGLDLDGCCRRCREMACAAAVFSGPSDHPPQACWLKSAVAGPAISKPGVMACGPSLGELPRLGDAPPPPVRAVGSAGGGGGRYDAWAAGDLRKLGRLPVAGSEANDRARQQVLEGRAAAVGLGLGLGSGLAPASARGTCRRGGPWVRVRVRVGTSKCSRDAPPR